MTKAASGSRARVSREEVERRHVLDLQVSCRYAGCGAGVGQECNGLSAGRVHFQRRICRLLGTGAT